MELSRFKLPITKKDPKLSNTIVLSYQKMRSLLSMLKPNHFFMTFDYLNFSNETVMKAIGHLDLASDKIALGFKGNFQTEFSLLLDHFSRRKLDYLWGSADFMTRSDVSLKMGNYDAEIPVNNVQLHKIFGHNLDALRCIIDDSFINEPASLSSLSSDDCNSLKWFHIICNQHYTSLMLFLDVIKDKCPKLKEIRIDVVITRENSPNMPRVSNVDEILDHILYAKGKMQKIIEKCRSVTSRLKIGSNVQLFYNSVNQFSCDWIEQAKTIDWFKDATHEELVEKLGNRAFNIYQLSSKFYDGFLELDHEIKLYRLRNNE